MNAQNGNIFHKNGNNLHNIGYFLPSIAFILKELCSNGMVFANPMRIIIKKALACAPL